MSEAVTCPTCGNHYEVPLLFCPNCGSNIQLPDKMKTLENSDQKQNIDKNDLEAYKQLKAKIGEMKWVKQEIAKQKQHLKTLNSELNKHNVNIDRLKLTMEGEKRDVDNLGKFSMGSLKSRFFGSTEERKQKEEQEYVQALADYEAMVSERDKLSLQMEKAKTELNQLEELWKSRDKLEAELIGLIHKATEGIKDEVEDQIELEISNLVRSIDPLVEIKSKFQTALSYLQVSQEYLRNASFNVEGEKKRRKSNALLGDLFTKEEVAEIKDQMSEAGSFLKKAYTILLEHQMPNITPQPTPQSGFDITSPTHTPATEEVEKKGLFTGSEMWGNFLQELIRDLKSGFKTKEQTKLQLAKAIADVNRIISWVSSMMKNTDFELQDLMDELKNKEERLSRERLRIIEERINQPPT